MLYTLRPNQLEELKASSSHWADIDEGDGQQNGLPWSLMELIEGSKTITLELKECKNGHILIGENWRYKGNKPRCFACEAIRNKKKKGKKALKS